MMGMLSSIEMLMYLLCKLRGGLCLSGTETAEGAQENSWTDRACEECSQKLGSQNLRTKGAMDFRVQSQ